MPAKTSPSSEDNQVTINGDSNTESANLPLPLSLDTLKNLIEVLGKSLLGLLGICFSLGLVVVNVHLSHFGLYSLALFRLNYIAAGIWAIAFVFAPAVIFISIIAIVYLLIPSFRRYLLNRFQIKPTSKKESVALNRLVAVFFILLTLAFIRVIYHTLSGLDDDTFRRVLFSFQTGAITSWVFMLFPFLVAQARSHIFSGLTRTALASIITVLILFAHTWDFATKTYGIIPSHIGGGKPTKVQLLLNIDSEARMFLANSGVTFNENSNLTGNLKVVLVTEDEYVLVIEKVDNSSPDKAISLKRDMVQAVLYNEIPKERSFDGWMQ